MRVCIVSYDEYINIPYIEKYEKILKQKQIEYDIILWDRRNVVENHPENQYIFRCNTKRSKLSKVLPFFKWRNYVLQKLKQKEYDSLIVLTSIPAVLIHTYLFRFYKENYVFDIRDYTLENSRIYRIIINNLVKHSKVTFISSDGFRNWLPSSDKICLTHNISNINQEVNKSHINLNLNDITIGFVGGIRYYKENCKLVNAFSKYENIRMKYIGKVHTGIHLEQYCKNRNINNVIFEPEYQNFQKYQIYQNIDIINSVYGSDTLVVKTALPNKLYDCVLYKKPIMVSNDTYLAEIVENFHLGFAVDLKQGDIYQKLEQYVNQFDEKLFLEGCSKWLNKVLKEESHADGVLNNWADNIIRK